jgi:hypothetical protein
MQRANPTTDLGRLDADQSAQLNDLGIVILEGLMNTAFCARLRWRIARLHELEGERAGAEFKQESGCLRLANLVAKGDKPQQQHQKTLLPADVQRGLLPELRALLALDDSLNDELAHSTIPHSGFLA